MKQVNAQSNPSQKGRSKKECQLIPFRNHNRNLGRISPRTENQQIRTSRDGCQGGGKHYQRGEESFGGILQQLIADTLKEIHDSESRTEQLRNRLGKLQSLFNVLDAEVQQDIA